MVFSQSDDLYNNVVTAYRNWITGGATGRSETRSSAPILYSLEPNPLVTKPTDSILLLHGARFEQYAYVEVDGVLYPLQLTQRLDENTLQLTIPANSPVGTYSLQIVNPISNTRSNALSLTVVPQDENQVIIRRPTPTPLPTPTPVPTPIPTPRPIEPTPSCRLLSASWNVNKAIVGDTVTLHVEGTDGCSGQLTTLHLQESDAPFGNDEVETITTKFFGSTAVASWTIAGIEPLFDSFLEGDLELFFTASLTSPSLRIATSDEVISPILEVSPASQGSGRKQQEPSASFVHLGRGCTFAFGIDWDCDGYGPGIKLDGQYGKDNGYGDKPDADDNDVTVNTFQSVEAKYGLILPTPSNPQGNIQNLKGFLRARGYTANRVLLVDPDPVKGNDITGTPDDLTKPYRTWREIRCASSYSGQCAQSVGGKKTLVLQPGDVVLFRGGIYTERGGLSFSIDDDEPSDLYIQGSVANPIVVMGFPGENVVINYEYNALGVGNAQYVTVDGFISTCDAPAPGCGPGRSGGDVGGVTNVIMRNIESLHHTFGIFHFLRPKRTNFVMERMVVHDNGEHGIYLASDVPGGDDGITLRDSLSYRNGWTGIQFNGLENRVLIENNIIHSNGIQAVSFYNGVQDSIVRNNLFFNNNRPGIVIYLKCDTGYYNCDLSQKDPRACLVGQPDLPGYPKVPQECHTLPNACGRDSNGNWIYPQCVGNGANDRRSNDNNLIVNNIFWLGKYNNGFATGNPTDQPAILIHAVDNTPEGFYTFKGNVFRNNILIDYRLPIFSFYELRHLPYSLIENNIIYRLDGVSENQEPSGLSSYDTNGKHTHCLSPGCEGLPNGFGYGWTLDEFQKQWSQVVKNNIVADPKFTDVSVDYYNKPGSFNFDFKDRTSPAIDFGLLLGAPLTDLRGSLRVGNPDAGSYEFFTGGGRGNPENYITITEKDGKTTTNYPLQIGRPFIQAEIPRYPQAILVRGSTRLPLQTQADIKQHWPDGSVKYAILTFYIPTLNANEQVTVEFADQPLQSNVGLDRVGMLDTKFDFDAVMQLTASANTLTASAREMLTNNNFAYWMQGPVATSVILTDHSVARRYDLGFDQYRSFRPIFLATFFPSAYGAPSGAIRVRYIGENSNTETLQDLRYDLALQLGFKSPTTVYTKMGVPHAAASRWTKEFWIGGVPSTVDINYNLAYLTETTFVPNYDLRRDKNTILNELLNGRFNSYSGYKGWNNGAAKDLYDVGFWQPYMPGPGGRPEIGPYPKWVVQWLFLGDYRAEEITLGNADLAGAWPMHFREGDANKYFDRTTKIPGSGLGKPVSISNRPSVFGDYLQNGDTGDAVVPVGSIASNSWQPDSSHQPDPFSVVYTLTGDYWYLEEMEFWASWQAAKVSGGVSNDKRFSYLRGPTGEYGGLNGAAYEPRAHAWPLRNRVQIAFLAPDNTPEKVYFTTLTNDALTMWEGSRDVPCSLCAGNAENQKLWDWGNTIGKGWWGYETIVGGKTQVIWLDPPTVIHFWQSPGTDARVMAIMDPAETDAVGQPWQHYYLTYALGRAKELGFKTDKLLSWIAPFLIGEVTSAGYDARLLTSGSVPEVSKRTYNWFTTWPDIQRGYDQVNWIGNGEYINYFNTQLTNPDGHGYIYLALSAASMIVNEPGGCGVWSFMEQNNVPTNPEMDKDPKWDLLPRVNTCSGQPFTYTLRVLPTSGSVEQGKQLQTTVSLTLLSGTTEAVTFSITGLPQGVTADFSPKFCTPSCSSPLTFTAAVNAPPTPTPVQVTITGTSVNNVVQKATFDLTVRQPNPPPSITRLNPDVVYNDVDTSVDIEGTNFDPATLLINGQVYQGPWTPVSSTLIKMTVLKNASPGFYTVVVVNKDLQQSKGVQLEVKQRRPAPTLFTPVPQVVVNDRTTQVIIDGQNIDAGAKLLSNSLEIPAQFYTIAGNRITLTIPKDTAVSVHALQVRNIDTQLSNRVYLFVLRPFDFIMALNPSSVVAKPGDTVPGTATLTYMPDSYTPESVTFSAQPSDPRITTTFTPSSCTPSPTCQVQMETQLPLSLPAPALYTVDVTGTASSRTHTTRLTLDTISGGPGDCSNGRKDSHETDVDCGGPICSSLVPPLTCANGKACLINRDCTSILCWQNVCEADEDRDGVPDRLDKCPKTPLNTQVSLKNGCPYPRATKFVNSLSTDFIQVDDLLRIKQLALGIPGKGVIQFGQDEIPVLRYDSQRGYHLPFDLDAAIAIDSNFLAVNSLLLPEFNKAATVTLYGLSYRDPVLLKDEVLCGSACSIKSYTAGDLIFTAPGFSNYSSQEGRCGDTVCSSQETCSSCSQDCGSCGGGGSGSGGGGGGGGGGGPSQRLVVDLDANVQQTISLFKGSRFTIKYQQVEYGARLPKATTEDVVLATVAGTYNVFAGQKMGIDLNGDSRSDATVEYVGLRGNTITLTFSRIIKERIPTLREPQPPGAEEPLPSNFETGEPVEPPARERSILTTAWIRVPLVLFVLVLAFYFRYVRLRRM